MKGWIIIELKDLQALIHVADHLSFTKAAEHSYISQPSLSKSVKKLEEELDVILFNRSTRSLRLTDAGDIVYEQGHQILQLLGELPVLLEDLAEGVSGEIKIGMPPLIGTLFFPQIAKNLSRNYPHIKIELHELGAKVVEELVDKGQIDAGIIVLPTDQDIFQVQPFMVLFYVLTCRNTTVWLMLLTMLWYVLPSFLISMSIICNVPNLLR